MNQILTRKTKTEDVVSNGAYITGILVDSIYYLIRNFKMGGKMQHSEYIDRLIERMEQSYNNGFYFESMTVSYAILEDRFRSLGEKLGANMLDGKGKEKILFGKSATISEFLFVGRSNVLPKSQVNLIKRKLSETVKSGDSELVIPSIPILSIEESYKNEKEHPIDLISNFRVRRNNLVHELAHYTSATTYDGIQSESKKVAYLGKELVYKLSNLNNKVKRQLTK